MRVCVDGPPVEEFDPQPAVTHWLNSGVHRRRTEHQSYGPRTQADVAAAAPIQLNVEEKSEDVNQEIINIVDLFDSDDDMHSEEFEEFEM